MHGTCLWSEKLSSKRLLYNIRTQIFIEDVIIFPTQTQQLFPSEISQQELHCLLIGLGTNTQRIHLHPIFRVTIILVYYYYNGIDLISETVYLLLHFNPNNNNILCYRGTLFLENSVDPECQQLHTEKRLHP